MTYAYLFSPYKCYSIDLYQSKSDFIVLQILVEFDDQDWQKREWVRVHDIFQIFLVERTVIWAERDDPENPKEYLFWPALVSIII